jgi:hypothetical protein
MPSLTNGDAGSEERGPIDVRLDRIARGIAERTEENETE